MRGFSRVIVALAGALALTAGVTLPASATDSRPIHSLAVSPAKCVGLADNGSAANGTRLVLWDCHLNPDQYWFWGGNPLLRSTPSGKCVGLANNGSTANGTELVLWDCHGNPDQQWSWADVPAGGWALKNTPSGKCVGLANNGSTANGTRLVLWDCHYHVDQRWN
ncbi:RICIN domain-containing protein [Amycolatopsis sp. WQ 127309]|uniref:RICIN domain-containing protein n=1 Tax=Amycolatopsis sp. WQ 127309 TaxID=2932773 RepID=UPI001FF4B66D|nr:RICIN domain-containing protein [Amycolatopsis sp. WQ 127309]UOZ10382.1 RICIN domain-containing protein [Amycolatopsis sp. WQ 127309]